MIERMGRNSDVGETTRERERSLARATAWPTLRCDETQAQQGGSGYEICRDITDVDWCGVPVRMCR